MTTETNPVAGVSGRSLIPMNEYETALFNRYGAVGDFSAVGQGGWIQTIEHKTCKTIAIWFNMFPNVYNSNGYRGV